MQKGFTLFLSFLFLSFPLLAQERQIGPAERSYALEEEFGQIVRHNNARFSTDTIVPVIFDDECAESVFNFTITDRWGFLSGTNEFEDKEKAQRLSYTANIPFTVIETWAYFGAVSEVDNGNLRMKVYTVGNDGAPDFQKGVSEDINVSDIELDNEFAVPTIFTYPAPIAISPDTDFFVSVDFSDLYATNDTIGIFMTDGDCGDGLNTWELWSDDSWNAYIDSWTLDAEIFLGAVVEFAPTSTEDPFVQTGDLRLFPAQPNPASDQVSIAFSIEEANQAQLEIYTMDGRLVQQKNLGRLGAGSYNEQIDVSNLPAGTYTYGVQTDNNRLMSRFVVSR